MVIFKDHYGHLFTKRQDLNKINHKFYKELYQHKDIYEEELSEVFQDFLATFTEAMNSALKK